MNEATLYLFLDESFPRGTGNWPLRVGALVCSKARFRALSDVFFQHFAQRHRARVELLLRFIEECPAFAVVSDAAPGGVPEPAGRKSFFTDIGEVAWTNEVWVDTVGITVAAILAQLPPESWLVPRVEVLADDKSLTALHWSAVRSSIKRVLGAAVARDVGQDASVEIDFVQKRDESADNRWKRRGVLLAHWVAKLPEFNIEPKPGTYAMIDVSSDVSEMMQRAREGAQD